MAPLTLVLFDLAQAFVCLIACLLLRAVQAILLIFDDDDAEETNAKEMLRMAWKNFVESARSVWSRWDVYQMNLELAFSCWKILMFEGNYSCTHHVLFRSLSRGWLQMQPPA